MHTQFPSQTQLTGQLRRNGETNPRLLCEGGGKLAASLMRSELVDEMVTFHGGLAIGADGLSSIGDLGIYSLGEAKRWRLNQTLSFGADVLNIWRPTGKYIHN